VSKFHDRLIALGYKTYDDYLASDHWRTFRTSYAASIHPKTCAVCGSTAYQLHHHTYVRLGCEKLIDVTPLCRPHHEDVHTWLVTSGRVFVEFTHLAVRALKGETIPDHVPTPPKPPTTPTQQRCIRCKELTRKNRSLCEVCVGARKPGKPKGRKGKGRSKKPFQKCQTCRNPAPRGGTHCRKCRRAIRERTGTIIIIPPVPC
jgi:hypothetical protein